MYFTLYSCETVLNAIKTVAELLLYNISSVEQQKLKLWLDYYQSLVHLVEVILKFINIYATQVLVHPSLKS